MIIMDMMRRFMQRLRRIPLCVGCGKPSTQVTLSGIDVCDECMTEGDTTC